MICTESREYQARWALQRAQVEEQRDKAAALLRDHYTILVDSLVKIFSYIAETDIQVKTRVRRAETNSRYIVASPLCLSLFLIHCSLALGSFCVLFIVMFR